MQNKYFWAGLSIVTMWLAVLFVGVFGPTLDSGGPMGATGIPVALIVVAFFAVIGTVLVAIYGFRK